MKGKVRLSVLIGMVIMVIVLPVVGYLITQNQNIENKAASCAKNGEWSYAGKPCCTGLKQTDCNQYSCKCVGSVAISTPKPTAIVRYSCRNYTCQVDSGGRYTTLASCQNDCKTPTTAPVKPTTVIRYSCRNYTCQVDSGGRYTTLASCQTNCKAPTVTSVPTTVAKICIPGVVKCDGSTKKLCSSSGTFWTSTPCQYGCENSQCNEKTVSTTKYSCRNYSCVVDSGGKYTTLASCQNDCKTPTTVVKVTRYSCRSYRCQEDSGGGYTSLTSCEASCKTPTVAPESETVPTNWKDPRSYL